MRGIGGVHPIRRPCVVAWAWRKGGARPWPGRDPLARPTIAVGALSRWSCAAWRRGIVGLTCGVQRQRQRAKAGSARVLLGQSWAARAGAGWAELPGLSRPSPLLFSFLFFISFPLFKFKFGLEFEFKTEVTCSLEFREFCLIITLWNC